MMEQFVALRHRHGTISDMVGGRTKVSPVVPAAAAAAPDACIMFLISIRFRNVLFWVFLS